jgi:hypothetical protein
MERSFSERFGDLLLGGIGGAIDLELEEERTSILRKPIAQDTTARYVDNSGDVQTTGVTATPGGGMMVPTAWLVGGLAVVAVLLYLKKG